MEEDIKILEDLKNKWELNAFGDMVNVLSLDEINAIEKLLKRYKELEEEDDNKTQKIIDYEKTLAKLQKETIWKSKVINLIKSYEENEEYICEINSRQGNYNYSDGTVIDRFIKNLRKLLEE